MAGQSEPQRSQAPERGRAETAVKVLESRAETFDAGAGPPLQLVHIRERFSGDVEADSVVRALQVKNADGSASLASLQRVSGKLAGRRGSFVLQGSETVRDGAIRATWSVVPGSGTGELTGLRGEGGFEGHFGEGSHGTLDYWFE